MNSEGFHPPKLPTSASISIQRRPAPVPCPIDCAHNMPQPVHQRPSQRPTKKEEQKRKTKDPPPARGWLKANCGVPSFDLHSYKSNPGLGRHGTWHCYTRCSSCGLTTGSISDRRKVNFPKTLYTYFPWKLGLESSSKESTLIGARSLSRAKTGCKNKVSNGLKNATLSKLTKGFWPEAVSAPVFILNRMPSKRLKGRSPYPVVAETFQWTPSSPYVGSLRACCTAFVYDHSVARGDKFAPRAKKGILVGFEGDNIYRVWIPQDHKVIRSTNVTFGETSFGTGLTHESPFSIAMENDQESAAPWGVNKWEMAKIRRKMLDQILEPWRLQSQILGQ